MKNFSKLKASLLAFAALILGLAANLALPLSTYASSAITLSPPTSEIILQPGQTYTSSFRVYNTGDETLNYEAYVTGYLATSDDAGTLSFQYDEVDTSSGYSTIADWITLGSETGTIEPGDESGDGTYINYTITVPEDATPGGQYAAIMVEQIVDEAAGENVAVTSVARNAFLIYATVAGDLTETANISNNNIAGFFIDNKISASSMVENTGNVHGTVSYTLQVFPLFSDEEVYTNEEDPETHIIYPGTKYFNSTSWDETPSMGIYKVVQTVTLFGETSTTERIVVVCPLWLILVIVFIIVFIVVWLIFRSKKRKASAAKGANA